MIEFEQLGMQRLAFECCNGAATRFGNGGWRIIAARIDRIANDRNLFMREVNANLMGASGMQGESKLAERTIEVFHPGVCNGAPARWRNRHFLALLVMAADGQFNALMMPARRTPAPCQVLSIQIMAGKHIAQSAVGNFAFSDHHATGCILIESVHDTGALSAVDARQIAAVVEQGMHKGAVIVAVSRMDNHAGWFIDNEQMLIFKQDIKWNIFSAERQWLWRRDLQLEALPFPNLPGWLSHWLTGRIEHTPGFDQLLHATATLIAQGSQCSIKTLTGLSFINGETQMLIAGSGVHSAPDAALAVTAGALSFACCCSDSFRGCGFCC